MKQLSGVLIIVVVLLTVVDDNGCISRTIPGISSNVWLRQRDGLRRFQCHSGGARKSLHCCPVDHYVFRFIHLRSLQVGLFRSPRQIFPQLDIRQRKRPRLVTLLALVKSKFRYAILIADRSEAGCARVADLLAYASSLLAS